MRPRSSRPLLLLPLALLLLILALSGCSGARRTADVPDTLPDAFPNHTAQQILTSLARLPDSLQAFSANASVAMTTPDNSGSFNARMVHRRDDSLYLSIRVTLGIEAARSLITPDSFFVYDRIQKTLIYGALDEAGTLLPAPFTGQNLLPELLGYLTPDPTLPWRVEADSQRYYLIDPDGRYTYGIDPALWRVVYYIERSPSGTMVEERTFDSFDAFGGLYLPRRFIFRRPADEVVASVYYRSLTLNPPSLTFNLGVDDNVKRVPATDLQ